MSLAKGYHSGGRFSVVKQHRLDAYIESINRLIDGEGSPEKVAYRAKKVRDIKKHRG